MAPALHQPLRLPSVPPLSHRVVMSAMTRLRADDATGIATPLMAKYYGQRASEGGLLVSEGTYPCLAGKGYLRMPGIATPEQVDSWRPITDAVHEQGGAIFCQLMHSGRVSHSSMQPDGVLPVAPSPVGMGGKIHTANGKVDYETPRELSKEELPTVAQEFATAAKNAIAAGFDGVELHGGNGYLLQTFLAKKTNQRSDEYGGDVAGRAKFVLEVLDATVEAVGSEKVGIKLQGGVTFSDLVEDEEDVLAQLDYLGPELTKRNLAYVCLSSLNGPKYSAFARLEKPNIEVDLFKYFRERYEGTLMINGDVGIEGGNRYIEQNMADLVSYGALFVATADLPQRIKEGQEPDVRGADPSTWYAKPDFTPEQDEHHYVDW